MTSSQFNPEKLVFFIGIPGSGWAKIDSLLRCCKKFNFSTSDFRDDRNDMLQTKYYVEHKGHFSGPGCEFGKGFEDLPKYHTEKVLLKRH